ncbi:MAG: flagellar assembly protein FliW [Treponema sp.]|nr:flagellar assembly protein FliW [Treponema sp.]MCL2250946.1 flagellar assembly protein FliW [Treponema sp.]
MKVDTKAYGLIEIDDKQKLTIPNGLFGFEDYKDYIIMDAEQEPFVWLQSVEVPEIAFILINPFVFRKDYIIHLSDDEQNQIGLTSPENALTFVIVTIPQDGGPMTANLQGPIVINKNNMNAMQAVLTDSRWRTKHDIMAEYKSGKGN